MCGHTELVSQQAKAWQQMLFEASRIQLRGNLPQEIEAQRGQEGNMSICATKKQRKTKTKTKEFDHPAE